jgi:hypothetical protein
MNPEINANWCERLAVFPPWQIQTLAIDLDLGRRKIVLTGIAAPRLAAAARE